MSILENHLEELKEQIDVGDFEVGVDTISWLIHELETSRLVLKQIGELVKVALAEKE